MGSEGAATLEVLEFIQPFFYGALTVVAFVQWRRHPGRASAWLCAAFTVLGAVLIAGRVLPEETDGPAAFWAHKAVIAILVLFPYFLHRFMRSLVRPIPWIKTAASMLTAALVLGALMLPSIPEEGEPRPGWFQVYVAALLIQWVFLSGLVAVRLWRAGRDQPSVARRRMRMMSLGAAGLALALVVAGKFSNGGTGAVVVQLLALAAAPMMMIGFAPPYALRAWWRREEEAALRQAGLSLMEATSTSAVAATLLPRARGLLGGKAAVLYTSDGVVVARDGVTEAEEAKAGPAGTDDGGSDPASEDSSVSIALGSHRLIVQTSAFTPFFGREEISRLESFAALADLALARNALLDEQRVLASIVESSDDAILSATLDGTIMSWNRSAEKMYGYSSAEAVGKPVSIIFLPELLDEVPAILERVRSKESIEYHETKRQTKDGRTIDVSMTISPIRDTDGTVAGAFSIARDVTERKRQQELLSAIFDTSPDIIATITSRLELTFVNPAAREVLGYEFEELLGKESLHWVHPDDAEVALHLLQSAFTTGEPGGMRLRVKNVAREWVWLDIRIRWMGSTGTAVVSGRDITEQVQLEEELEEAKRVAEEANLAKSVFLSRSSHELRTPLNAILGFGQLLEMEELSPDQRASTEQIIKGGRRLLELINEVLDISRIETGTLRMSLEPVLVEGVVRDAVELIRPLADGRGIRLRSELTPDMQSRHVIADQQRLGQVLLSLLSNAVKYNADEGTVSVTAVSDGDRIRIGVTDNGPGIPEDKIPRLFAPFERLGAEQTRVEGSGLGLTLSKSLIEAMGGSLGVDTTQDQGTTFWIEVRATDGPSPETRPTPAHEVDQPGAGGKVLYIDDNLSNLRLIERLVSHRAELELIPAMSGTLGIELAQQHIPDLVLLDLQLPDLRGEEVLIRLRKDPRTRSIPVVILSADATPGLIERLRAAGADEYLTKPIDVLEFLALIDRILGPPTGTP